MEIKYRRERNECYMLVDAGGIDADDYQIRMLEHNRIGGLLKVRLQQINQQSELCYTISGRQSMVRKYENVTISIDEIKQLMAALNKTAGQLEEFLLNIDSLQLEPEWIYWKEDGDGPPEFCYYPKGVPDKSFREHVRILLQYLLNKISHKEIDAVNAVYGLYQIGIRESFRMQDLMQLLFYGEEEKPEPDGEEVLSPGLPEDEEWKTDDGYAGAVYEMSDEERREQEQKKKRRKHQKQKEKQRRSSCFRRSADTILALLVALLALAAVSRLAFLCYGRWEMIREREAVIYIGLICGIAAVSGTAIYKLMVKTDASAAAVWESPEEAAAEDPSHSFQWEKSISESQNVLFCQKHMPKQENVSGQGDLPVQNMMPEQRDFTEETCVLTGISGAPAVGWWFRYQGEEKNIEDFFLSGQEGQVMVGKQLKAPDISLNRSTVSRRHAVFQIRNGICTVKDCDSTNGTYLNGDRLGREERCFLAPGSELKFADVAFRIEEMGMDENATTILTPP